MKVTIGPYRSWIDSNKVASTLLWWWRDWESPDGEDHPWVRRLSSWLDFPRIYEWINKRNRKVYVRIDNWDIWNTDQTLAYIIHPLLVQLKHQKQGSPWVDLEDVPEHLRSETAEDNDELLHARWDWVLDEMIWSFEQHTKDWESEYYSGDIDFTLQDGEFVTGPKDTFKVDRDGIQLHEERMANGLRLFAKYYRGLWI